jgi:integrase
LKEFLWPGRALLLKNNVHPKIVSERLGHSSIQITLDTYSHLLPNMQKDAAGKLGEEIFGKKLTIGN